MIHSIAEIKREDSIWTTVSYNRFFLTKQNMIVTCTNMNVKLDQLQKLEYFENILVVDELGTIIFCDSADLSGIIESGLRPEKYIGYNIASLLNNIENETSTIMDVLKTGVPICNNKQHIVTINGNSVTSINSTYPIIEDEKIVGAIEFSKFIYNKESINVLDNYKKHKIYRKNNTIYTIDDIITVNPKMLEIKDKISRVAKTDSSVLIYGKTGTGKEVVAQAIHNMSKRYRAPFVSLNCGAIPATLLESILFGTVKGSFTGSNDAQGFFEQASGGTLFLDEINSLDVSLQGKLLKAIEEKTIRRIGGNKNIELDIRIISATNEYPEEMISERRLRKDLFYRLGVVEINIPTLSERKEDIPCLTDFFINLYNNKMDIYINRVHPQVLDCFYKYDWPGNIRELKNSIETAYNNACSTEIQVNDIPARISSYQSGGTTGSQDMNAFSLKKAIEDYEKLIIVNELNSNNYKIAETARNLGMSKQLLKYKTSKYMIK